MLKLSREGEVPENSKVMGNDARAGEVFEKLQTKGRKHTRHTIVSSLLSDSKNVKVPVGLPSLFLAARTCAKKAKRHFGCF